MLRKESFKRYLVKVRFHNKISWKRVCEAKRVRKVRRTKLSKPRSTLGKQPRLRMNLSCKLVQLPRQGLASRVRIRLSTASRLKPRRNLSIMEAAQRQKGQLSHSKLVPNFNKSDKVVSHLKSKVLWKEAATLVQDTQQKIDLWMRLSLMSQK